MICRQLMIRCSLIVVTAAAGPVALAAERGVVIEWRFDKASGWGGWLPNGGICEIEFGEPGAAFRATGADPQIMSPLFDGFHTSNGQWVEIDLDCDSPGVAELFYTNKTTGQYGGLEPSWVATVAIPSAGRQVVCVWPFWESLGKIIRLRFDPPSGAKCRLYSIRVVEAAGELPEPKWTFQEPGDSWRSMYAARLERGDGQLRITAQRPQALIITPVRPFEADKLSILRLDADCPGEDVLSLHWVTREQPGLYGEPVELRGGKLRSDEPIDLRRFPGWRGTITHLAISFGTFSSQVLTIRSLSIDENDPGAPVLRVGYSGFERAINRPGEPAQLRIVLEHAGGPPMPACQAVLTADAGATCPEPRIELPAMDLGDRFTVQRPIVPRAAGRIALQLDANGQHFHQALRIDPPLGSLDRSDYEVPPPRPVNTKYQIGIYYFPGWSPDQMSRWKYQADFPERDPVLGWYEEGRPEVADWHIKWAVENGISFFVYDWYWRDGKEDLAAGLNEGFLKARYCDRMKFALMWANHRPFSDHTVEQLLTVTDYWIDRYFRRPNYLTVDGKPYVSFFTPGELMAALGSEAKVKEAFEAMRERVRAAGLPGLHIGACSGPDRPGLEALRQAGFDSVTAYNYVRTGTQTAQSPYRHFLLGHEAIWESTQLAGVLPYIPLLTVGWDSRPWHGPRAERRFARRTQDFAEALARLKANLDATGGRMAILEAWNEWGEGSYIEPNVEFGFEDLEAIRATSAEPGDWPVNIGPDDVGLGGKYDLRRDAAATRAAQAFGKVVPLVGIHPAVVEGIELKCWEDRIAVGPGRAKVGDRTWTSSGGSVAVPPAEVVEIERLPIELKAGKVESWRGGNRLIISPDDGRNLLPGSFVPGSLRLRDADRPAERFTAPQDYVVDDEWGAFAIPDAGRLKPGQRIVARYRMSLRRIDALVFDASGKPTLVPGTAAPHCPEPPALPDDVLHLANIYRPFRATGVESYHIYALTESLSQLVWHGRPARVRTGETPVPHISTEIGSEAAPDLSPIRDAPGLAPVLARLRNGQEVTIVCWGDSVTAGGDASAPEKAYVGLFETMLKERFPSASIRVVNAGIGGSNTQGRLPDFQKEVLDHHPHLVTLEFVNDMGLPVEQLQKRYEEILARTRGAEAALVIITPHFTMPAWMGLPNGRGPDPRQAVAFLRRFARENNVALADAARRWEQLEQIGIPYETLLKNGINHPDDRGHRFFAEELMRLLPQ